MASRIAPLRVVTSGPALVLRGRSIPPPEPAIDLPLIPMMLRIAVSVVRGSNQHHSPSVGWNRHRTLHCRCSFALLRPDPVTTNCLPRPANHSSRRRPQPIAISPHTPAPCAESCAWA